MTSKRSSLDPSSTHKNPNPNLNPNPNPSPSPKKKHKKKKSKHTDQTPNPSPSPTTPKKEAPMAVDHLPAPIGSPAKKQRKPKDFNDGDSLTILEAIIKFQSANGGSNPTPTNMKPLYESVKDSLHANYSFEKLYRRIRDLRARYYRLLETGHVGDSVTDRAFFNLSARAWSGPKKKSVTPSPIANGTAAPSPKKLKTEEKEKDDDGIDGPMDDAEDGGGDSFKFLIHHAKEYWGMTGLNADDLEMGLKSMDRAKAKALERKWVQHVEVGFKIQGKQSELETDLFVSLFAVQKGMN